VQKRVQHFWPSRAGRQLQHSVPTEPLGARFVVCASQLQLSTPRVSGSAMEQCGHIAADCSKLVGPPVYGWTVDSLCHSECSSPCMSGNRSRARYLFHRPPGHSKQGRGCNRAPIRRIHPVVPMDVGPVGCRLSWPKVQFEWAVLQKSTATNPTPADNEDRQMRRVRATRQ
jgi:hypothetical protein